MAREQNMTEFKRGVRAVLCEHFSHLDADTLITVTDRITTGATVAIDREVQDISVACGLIPEDEVGGSFM